jgi:hypothetical protein
MTTPPIATQQAPAAPGLSFDFDVISRPLNAARQQIQPSLGASVYEFSPDALQTIPQGDNSPLNQVLLQAPGVPQHSFGQTHRCGEHTNDQYRLNDVELPEGSSVFGQALEEHSTASRSVRRAPTPLTACRRTEAGRSSTSTRCATV